jgi:hypothetical protein
MKRKYYTVAMRKQTYLRLKEYTRSGATFDQVINGLMDDWHFEDVSPAEMRMIRQRLRTYDGVPWQEVRKALGDGKR